MSLEQLAAYLCFFIWLYLVFFRGRFWETRTLESMPVPSPKQWPEIYVITPARNEADILGETLPSLLKGDYLGTLRMLLVDDRSEDATASVAARIAVECGASDRVTVVSGKPLAGWKGKVRAMQSGLEYVSAADSPPRYVLFTDADIRYDNGTLARLVAKAEAGGFVLTSLMVRLRCESTVERLLIPAFVYFFKLLYPFAWVNQPHRKTAAAAGGVMLVRYDALITAGGLAPIHDQLIDDCALGRLLKNQGPIWLGLSQTVQSIRPYPHLQDIRAMVARSAFDQLGYRPLNLLGALLGMVLTYVAPVWLTFFGEGAAQTLGIASWILMSLSFLPLLRFYGRSLLLCASLPVVALFYMGFTLDAAVQYWRGKGGVWKGRVQATDAKVL